MAGCEKARELAIQVRAVSDQAEAAIQNFPDAKWNAMVPDEGRAANVLASHIAQSFNGFAGLLGAVTGGHPLPQVTDELFASQAVVHAAEHGGDSKVVVLQQLRDGSSAFIGAVESLSAEDIAKDSVNTFFNHTWQAGGVVQLALEHTSGHLEKLSAFA
jgi:hypothetical protein